MKDGKPAANMVAGPASYGRDMWSAKGYAAGIGMTIDSGIRPDAGRGRVAQKLARN